jgi:Membrane-bound lytic murein transglycosylase B
VAAEGAGGVTSRRSQQAGLGVVAALLVGVLASCAAAPAESSGAVGRATTTPTPQQSVAASPAPTATATAAAQGISDLASPAWIAQVAERAGIPVRAMAAYAGASIALAQTSPECGLGWNTLAAIGLVETAHGSFGGSSIGADGRVTPLIIGIPLNGNGVAAVADTDGGDLDGDAVWDRAVGPMQFIPDTWRRFAQDGNGDGVADIHQIDDAVLTAATYLCVAGGDLRVASDWIAAIDAYNPTIAYNNDVAEAATRYASLG